ncbi:hypothetical protein PLESTB_000593900 [Pleodorina starrii]|uniref:Ankyrin repeat domain-containing protein n=1 Tax=Pleodorina starrii TaxID=330485 RepID=A0A9W6F0U7_9CHLO|nr:hypothetical protein PLESTB_000593900 [Pleodorina starrii]
MENLFNRDDGPPSIWIPGVVDQTSRFLPANEVSGTLRFVNKATRNQFADKVTVLLSRPVRPQLFAQCWGRPGAFGALSLKQRRNFVCLVAASGSVDNLRVALDNAGLLPTTELLEAAAKAGQLEACELLRERGCPWGNSLASAAEGGHRHVCEWMLASGCPHVRAAVCAAARGGHEGLMLWLLDLVQQQGDPAAAHIDAEYLLEHVAAGLGLEALQRMHHQLLERPAHLQQQEQEDEQQAEQEDEQQQAEQEDEQQQAEQEDEQQQAEEDVGWEQQVLALLKHGWILAAAAGSPTPDWKAKVEWLEGLGYPRFGDASIRAANIGPAGNAVGRLQWLHGRGYPMEEYAAKLAAENGDSAALQFLLEQAGVLTHDIDCMEVAWKGHLDILQYLHGRGKPLINAMVARSAASGGHLHVVVWAVETLGVTPDNTGDLLDRAATSGNIELMSWLRDRGWAWGHQAVVTAAFSGRMEALDWILAHGGHLPNNGSPFLNAARNGDLAMILRLRQLGCPRDPELLEYCIFHGVPVPILRLLVELGCPVDDCANVAARVTSEMHPMMYRKALEEWLVELLVLLMLQQQQQQQQEWAPESPAAQLLRLSI